MDRTAEGLARTEAELRLFRHDDVDRHYPLPEPLPPTP